MEGRGGRAGEGVGSRAAARTTAAWRTHQRTPPPRAGSLARPPAGCSPNQAAAAPSGRKEDTSSSPWEERNRQEQQQCRVCLTRAHRLPRLLVQLVDGGADGAELLGRHPRNVQHRIQQPPVVQLDLRGRRRRGRVGRVGAGAACGKGRGARGAARRCVGEAEATRAPMHTAPRPGLASRPARCLFQTDTTQTHKPKRQQIRRAGAPRRRPAAGRPGSQPAPGEEGREANEMARLEWGR